MNSLLQFGLGIFVLLFLFSSFKSCSKQSRYGDSYNVSVQQISAIDASSGLDLQAVGDLVKRAKTGEEFERLLNDSSVGINNLDLDEDGKVDYIKVTEYGSGNVKGFSLTVDLANQQTQEVATIEIEKTSDGRANVQTYGNHHMYGHNHYYHSSFGLTDMLILGWLFNNNRPYYSSPWGYNSYPQTYRSYPTSSYKDYQRRTGNSGNWSRSTSPTVKTATASPNAGKSASNIKAPLKNPSTSQKSFQARNPSKQVKSGGFGRPSSTTSSVPSVKKTSSTSSFRSGGK